MYPFCDYSKINVAKILPFLNILLQIHPAKETQMLELSYMSPKPIINQHGVFFQKSKMDKYIYLSHAIGILKSINEYDKCAMLIFKPIGF